MIEPIQLWPSLIYKEHCPLDLSAIVEYCKTKFDDKSIHGLEKAGGKTTFNTCNNIIFEKECNELRQWIATVGDTVWKRWEFATDIPRYIHRSWVNLHPPGAFTAEHDHGQCHQTIVVYLKQPESGGNILFKDPLQYTFSGFPKIDRNSWKVVNVQQNDVLFFPGFLHHMTEKNNSDIDRLVMTVTVAVDIFQRQV
jgi:hypothetical protein